MTHVGHVAGEAWCTTKRRRLVLHAFGQLIEAVPHPLVSLGLAGHLTVTGLDSFFLHGQGSVDL